MMPKKTLEIEEKWEIEEEEEEWEASSLEYDTKLKEKNENDKGTATSPSPIIRPSDVEFRTEEVCSNQFLKESQLTVDPSILDAILDDEDNGSVRSKSLTVFGNKFDVSCS
jgi:hypothetical protein